MGDADITLRHIVRQHPEALVQALGMEGRVEITGWLDTQVTSIERRLDKALGLRVEGELRALHVEFEYELSSGIGRRLHEYQALFNLGRTGSTPDNPALPVESLVIVLTGRRQPWPAYAKHRTGWPEQRWSGLHYRIDAVYQRTVDELRARGSVLWLVFVPLACDATVAAVKAVILDLRARIQDPEELGDLYAALLVMADVNPWGHNLRTETAAMIEQSTDLIQVSKTLRDVFEKGIERGRREATLDILQKIFRRRLGRALTEQEQQALAARTGQHGEGAEEVQDRAFSMDADALRTWLLDPNAK